ncbi:olfactory receptor 2G3-like [Phyllostomus discolor]|uniref:Olfactory receptor 2G3-like n=1 Tax=Phyllostomus discolor TaxID=89673 RepID=A0A6J2LQZ9_9CHIR|nr:olfactory receptor 2G3-like [Phyllostomus discolor]XP_035880961.1 olfactory receptor 2G3-like [Phyllostomus discolor]
MQEPNQSHVTEFILLGFSFSPRTMPLLFSAFLMIYLLTILGNSTISILVCLDSHLHTPMYFFIGILSLLDLCYTTTTVPQMLAHMASQKKTISFASCVAQMYIFLVLGVTESWLFAIMSIDRYVAICHPLRYKVIMSPLLCGVMVFFCGLWGVISALLYTVFAMRLPYCGPNKINHFFCEVPAILKLACADTSVNDRVDFILGFISALVPLFLIFIIYVNILVAILRIRSAQGRLKAFSTCASHITVVTMFFVPVLVMYMKPGSEATPEEDKKLALFYNVISAFLNPIIYSLRNKDVKGAFLKVIGWGRAPE